MSKMTLERFIKDLQEELKENPNWKDKEVFFATGTHSELLPWLSIYDLDDKVIFDVGFD